jgi:hypothetical protein
MKKQTKRLLERGFNPVRRDLSFDKLVCAVTPFLETVNTPVALGVYLRLKYSSYEEYLSMDLNPLDYVNPDVYRLDYQCVKMFSKSEFFPSVYDTKKEAMQSFIQAELDCKVTNDRFITREDPDFRDPVLSAITYGAIRKISRILGDVPTVQEIPVRFGPGNNVGLSKTTSVYDKLTAELTLTGNAKSIAQKVMETCPAWASYVSRGGVPTPPNSEHLVPFNVVSGSILGFVPKNAKTDRPICTEPLLNSYIQLGIGKYLRNRLRKAGCNLNTQTRNQELARVGSLTNDLATIDLKSASDTISYMTVLELLPLPWFELLESCRSPRYTFEGKYYEFHKFSSMGNGYTFELESLIFLALSRSVCDFLEIKSTDVSVYGDDIIIPSRAVQLLRRVLKHFGFVVNETKSFDQGPFRESCGKDWFLGEFVRPLFLKSKPSNASLMTWCNHIYRISEGLLDPRYKVLYDGLYDLVNSGYKILNGPDGFGDGHFVVPWDRRSFGGHSLRRRGWEGHGYYTLDQTPYSKPVTDDAVYPAALYGAQFSTETSLTDKIQVSHLSRDGLLYPIRRNGTRTTLRRAFHPWKTG